MVNRSILKCGFTRYTPQSKPTGNRESDGIKIDIPSGDSANSSKMVILKPILMY